MPDMLGNGEPRTPSPVRLGNQAMHSQADAFGFDPLADIGAGWQLDEQGVLQPPSELDALMANQDAMQNQLDTADGLTHQPEW